MGGARRTAQNEGDVELEKAILLCNATTRASVRGAQRERLRILDCLLHNVLLVLRSSGQGLLHCSATDSRIARRLGL